MKATLLCMALGTISYCCQAQSIGPSALNAAGGSATISGKTYEWSVGEMTLVHTATAGSIVVTQGVLQPQSSQVGIDELPLGLDMLSVYPNPTNQFVYLEASLQSAVSLVFTLYDVLGRSLQTETHEIPSGKERIQIDLNPYAAGSYYLNVRVLQSGKQYRNSFEIKKIQ